MDAIPSGVIIALDRAGKQIIANRSAHELLGIPHGQNVGASMPPFRTPHAGVPVQPSDLPLHRVLRSGIALAPEDYEIRRADGMHRFVTMAAGPLFDDAGELRGALATLLDVTYLRTREISMKKERDGLSAMVAHQQIVAEKLQNGHLPRTLPSIPGIILSAVYSAAGDNATIGGDWYDAFALHDGRLGLSIGDVMGTGLDAAITMGKLRQAIQSTALIHPDPSVMLDAANATLALHDRERIATALGGILDARSGSLTFASAGHPMPLVRKARGQLVTFSGTSPPLGVYEAGSAERQCVELEPGDLVVFYTDGLIEEKRDPLVGGLRLERALRSTEALDPQNAADIIHRRILGRDGSRDDVAILTVARA